LTKVCVLKLRSYWRKLAIANAEPEIEASLSEELNDIYKPYVFEEVNATEGKEKNSFYRCYFE
jgi:hypothetical protein